VSSASAPSPHRRIELQDQEIKLPPVMQLRGYQQRWIDDPARFALWVKSARIGASYGTGVKHILRRLRRAGSTTTVLSASQAQSVEFVQVCQKNIQAIGAVAEVYQEPWVDDIGATDFTVQRIQFANGSRIMALAANPRTARGYPGDVVLDEFAHHENSYAIWAAAFRQLALGNCADVLSTPNGEQGKFFDLARDLGLADGAEPSPNPAPKPPWSGHWTDVHMAVAEGCPINIEEMRQGIKDDDTFSQEFLCVFLKAVGAWLPLDLIQAAEDEHATMEWPAGYVAQGTLFGGVDVGRSGDRTSFWLKEKIGDILWTRMVLPLHAMPFPDQARALNPWIKLARRTAVDTTGLGIGLYDDLVELDRVNKTRIMGVNFSGSSRLRQNAKEREQRASSVKVNEQGVDGAVRLKTDLAVRIKRSMEGRKERIPYDPEIRQELQMVKREQTASGVTFDAPRIEIETAIAGGVKHKAFAHADHFWAHALATYAADGGILSLDVAKSEIPTAYSQTEGYL
jgi:phage FluMu gp28-like protein